MQKSQPSEKIFSFQLPRKILFGVNASETAGAEAKALGGKEALLVTDGNMAKLGVSGKIVESLVKEGLKVDVFDAVDPEPVIEVAETVAKAARKKRYDVVVGVGGGSVLDMAKVAAVAPTNPGPMRSYVGVDLVKEPGVPTVLLPTTSGTGSEVTNVAVVTIAEDEMKTSIISPHIFGHVAIVDPTLTYSLPPRLTASTGLDALSHALEALISVNSSPITDALAYQAVNLIYRNLLNAQRKGDPESRYGMSLGSLIAGMAFGSAGVCLGHAAAYSFAVSHRVTHGVSCGLVLPYIFRFSAPAIPQKLPEAARAMNFDVESLKSGEMGDAISDAILKLMGELQVPRRLRDVGITREDLPKLADKLFSLKRLILRCPRQPSKEDALKLFEEMW
jgi:alcohol dehydrogenase class IV